MKTCSAAALELRLPSCFIRKCMRLIVHFYSELTSNNHRVFVITSFCDHMWNLVISKNEGVTFFRLIACVNALTKFKGEEIEGYIYIYIPQSLPI